MVVPTATRTELVWKSDIWLGDKALRLKATVAEVIHYCQLGKLAVMRNINKLRFFLPEQNLRKSANF
jgi:hypothetical protein